MRNTLEKELAGAKPDASIGKMKEWETVDEFLKFYLVDNNVKKVSIDRLAAITGHTVKDFSPRWETLSWLIGTIYRAHVEGYKPMELMGNMSAEEINTVMTGMNLLKTKLGSVSTAGRPQTHAKTLYDYLGTIG